ncbi:HxlR family transcriptional regulator [Blastococcus colisei]|uniref:HxlR family transcriptional regulator n=1 Tax=Blastococcus colisei TaxID=1564162 RepID=A0A543PDH6_9ACTN|nr:helix-turn-helix domain-containing protein [Blastococcus colisei]TQN42109.1 HxlR family transcriptional regulator [Blastococcus colisei]
MAGRKTYGQFCALARAMDHVGDRWTLLVVRELLIAPARYGDLAAALPGAATNLIAQRLRQLTDDGIVERIGPAGAHYALTSHGRGLEPVIMELIRWGAAYMATGPGNDVVDERWAWLAVRALLEGLAPGLPPGAVAVRCGEFEFSVVVEGSGRHVVREAAGERRAVVSAPLPALLGAVASGEWDDVRLEGDGAFARAVLDPGSSGRPPWP